MKLKTFKMLDISTGHIEKHDVDMLETHGCAGLHAGILSDTLPFSVKEYEEGFIINVSCIDPVKDCGLFSHHFQRIVRLAKEECMDYIMFDRDGEVYPDLPTFDW